MKKIIIFILFPIIVFSQSPSIQWQKVYGGQAEVLSSIALTSDGGYILAGTSASNTMAGYGDITINSIQADTWIIKITEMGVKQWQRKIRGNGLDTRPKIKQTSDGGYIIGIDSDSGIGYDKTEPLKGASDYWILKLDNLGNTVWQKSIGGFGPESISNLELTNDGGYIISGSSSSTASGDKTENRINNSNDYWIVKLDSVGNVVWDNTIGGNFNDTNPVIKQTLDGGYIISGYSESNISVDKTENSYGNFDYWVVKIDENGVVQWDKTIGGDYVDYSTWVEQSSDGNYYIAGYSYSGISGLKSEPNNQGDIWIIKLDNSGNILWENTIGGNYNEQFPYIKTTTDGGLVMICGSFSDISGDKTENNRGVSVTTFTEDATDDYWFVKISSNGVVQWDKTLGGSESDFIFGNSIQQTSDGGFIIGGSSKSPISGDKTIANYYTGFNFWILKLSPENLSIIGSQLFENLWITNPIENSIQINTSYVVENASISITDILGKTIFNLNNQTINEMLEIPVSLSSGVYLITIKNSNGSIVKKVVKE